MCSCEQRGKKKRKNAVVNVQTTTATARPLAESLTAGEKSDVTRKKCFFRSFSKTFGEETAVRKIRERDLLYFCCISNNPQKRERGGGGLEREKRKTNGWTVVSNWETRYRVKRSSSN